MAGSKKQRVIGVSFPNTTNGDFAYHAVQHFHELDDRSRSNIIVRTIAAYMNEHCTHEELDEIDARISDERANEDKRISLDEIKQMVGIDTQQVREAPEPEESTSITSEDNGTTLSHNPSW